MTAELLTEAAENQSPSGTAAAAKKTRETERRRRRRKQKKNKTAGVEIEYVPEKVEFDGVFDKEFREIFEKFSFKESAGSEENDKKDKTAAIASSNKKADSDSEEEELDAEQQEKGVSNKKKKFQRRMKIAELKQICRRPDVVEVWDATSADPKLVVFLKSYRTTVPVPRDWSQKRKFLQGKRGIEEVPFQLPDFIAATGIEKIRQNLESELAIKVASFLQHRVSLSVENNILKQQLMILEHEKVIIEGA